MSFRQSQSVVHTWSGLVVGWVLYLIFLTGTVSFWREDISRWMRPELGASESAEQLARGAVAFLTRTRPDAASWEIDLPGASGAGTLVYWEEGRGRRRARGPNRAVVGGDGERLHARDTLGGEYFYRLHFDLHYVPAIWARLFVGFCSMMMLVAIVTGVITHRRIFRDFFTFRRGKGARTWLDGHNALAVVALPFHLMITYTGLVALMTVYMPWPAVANHQAVRGIADPPAPPRHDIMANASERTPAIAVIPLMRHAKDTLGVPIGRILVDDPGRAARVTFVASQRAGISNARASASFSAATGRLLWRSSPPQAATQATGVMIGLHAARFAPDQLRWLYFLSGLGGTAMVATGLILWSVKRRGRTPGSDAVALGHTLVERLNIGVLAGLPLAMTAYLWANRLLPVRLAARAEWEVHVMFSVWVAALAFAFVRPSGKAFHQLVACCGYALLALPVGDWFSQRGIPEALMLEDGRMVAMNVVLLVFGAVLTLGARDMRRRGALVHSAAAERTPPGNDG